MHFLLPSVDGQRVFCCFGVWVDAAHHRPAIFIWAGVGISYSAVNLLLLAMGSCMLDTQSRSRSSTIIFRL